MNNLDIGIAQKKKVGQAYCGDSFWISRSSSIVAIVDGLGSGVKALEASKMAVKIIKENKNKSFVEIIEKCHENIKSTRGAVLGLLRFDWEKDKIFYAGIGNIICKIFTLNQMKTLPNQPGIIGSNLTNRIRVFDVVLPQNFSIFLFSDGVSIKDKSVFKTFHQMKAQNSAEEILRNHRKFHDDATAIVLKSEG